MTEVLQVSDYVAAYLPDLIARSQEADLQQAESKYQAEKAAREELQAKSRAKNEVNISELTKQMYGSQEAPLPSVPVLKPSNPQEKRDGRPVERFPVPPTTGIKR